MAIVLAEIQLNERDGQLIVDKYLYNNSFPEYNEESYYRLWKESIPFDEWAEDSPRISSKASYILLRIDSEGMVGNVSAITTLQVLLCGNKERRFALKFYLTY